MLAAISHACSDLISTMTGGDAEIQDIQPYFGDHHDHNHVHGGGGLETAELLDLKELANVHPRSAKTVSPQAKT